MSMPTNEMTELVKVISFYYFIVFPFVLSLKSSSPLTCLLIFRTSSTYVKGNQEAPAERNTEQWNKIVWTADEVQ